MPDIYNYYHDSVLGFVFFRVCLPAITGLDFGFKILNQNVFFVLRKYLKQETYQSINNPLIRC